MFTRKLQHSATLKDHMTENTRHGEQSSPFAPAPRHTLQNELKPDALFLRASFKPELEDGSY